MIKAIIVAVIVLCSASAYALSGNIYDQDGNRTWYNVDSNGKGTAQDSDGNFIFLR